MRCSLLLAFVAALLVAGVQGRRSLTADAAAAPAPAPSTAAAPAPAPADLVAAAAIGGTSGAFTLADVAKHNTEADAWIAINGNVYDITKWIPIHPGGPIILNYIGGDASDIFAAMHSGPRAPAELKKYKIGVLVQP